MGVTIRDVAEEADVSVTTVSRVFNHHVGSILNVAGQAFSVEHWGEVMRQIQRTATEETRLGIPVLYGIDAVHGVNYTHEAILFPQNQGLAATWNPVLPQGTAKITARNVLRLRHPVEFFARPRDRPLREAAARAGAGRKRRQPARPARLAAGGARVGDAAPQPRNGARRLAAPPCRESGRARDRPHGPLHAVDAQRLVVHVAGRRGPEHVSGRAAHAHGGRPRAGGW